MQGRHQKAGKNFALGGIELNGTNYSEAGRYSYTCSCHVHSGTESDEDSVFFLRIAGLGAWAAMPLKK